MQIFNDVLAINLKLVCIVLFPTVVLQYHLAIVITFHKTSYTNNTDSPHPKQPHMYIFLSRYTKCPQFKVSSQHYETVSRPSIIEALEESIDSILNHLLCSQTNRQEIAKYCIFSSCGFYLL